MSPAPQGNPEVEKYIGSYLISQRIPPGAKSTPVTKRFQNPHKQKSPETEKVRSFNKYCYPQREHAPRYPVPTLPVEYPGNQPYKHPGGWAGVPLISMTSGNHRRNKKIPAANNGQTHKYQPKHHPNHNGFNKGKETEDTRPDGDRLPLTRLAIHTQGAPLIQAGRYNGGRCRNGYNRDQARVFRGDCARWEAAKDPKTVEVQNQSQACASGSVDNSSVASDESSGNSENSLPRIIKPRKRRKKDRKPLAGATPPTSTSNEPSQFAGEKDQKAESSVKTYLPLCFEQDSVNSKDNNKDLLGENSITPVDEKQSEDLIDTFTSDEFPFGNLLDDEEDKDSELSFSATVCQCRYCDPSGVIWDVDQRCYSPFLTPPSPTDPFSSSLPLTFPPITPFVMDPSSPQHPRYYPNPDLGSMLRRSWSDPSSYKLLESVKNAEADRDKGCRPSSPLGLQVSSEIVTSPNGHRDIEIKFYSSSVPLEPKISANDRVRCFAAEE